MGLAVPLIGVAVSAASAVAGLSAQQKQAEAQRAAIEEQEKNVQSNTTLRLMDLERQKLYSQYMAQISTARQEQLRQQDDMELQTARMRDTIQNDQAALQNEEQYAIGMTGNDNSLRRATAQNNIGLNVGNSQLQNQYEIGTGLLSNEAASAQAGLDFEYTGAMGNTAIGKENAFLQSLGIDQQALQTRVSKDTEAYGIESQALGQSTQVLAQVAQAFLQNRTQGKQNAKGRAAARAAMGAMGGNGSLSMQGQESGAVEDDLDQFVNTIMQGGRAADSAMSRLGLSKSEADAIRKLGGVLGTSLESQAEGARGTASAQAGLDATIIGGKYQTGTNDIGYKRKMAGMNARDEYVLNQLALSDQHSLAKMSNEETYIQNKLGMQSVMSDNRLNINDARNLNSLGFDTYESARNVQFDIDQAQTILQNSFYDLNNASAANTISSDAASQLAALRASRSSIQSPGLLSYASVGFQAYQGISGALPQKQQMPQQQQQFGTSNFNYQPGSIVNQPQFTGQSNYGVLSGYKVGGGY